MATWQSKCRGTFQFTISSFSLSIALSNQICHIYQNLWQSSVRCYRKRIIDALIKEDQSELQKVSSTLRCREEFENAGFTLKSENAPNVFRPYCARRIWKRNNQRPFWIFVWGELGQGKHMIIVTSSFSKNCFFKMFIATRKLTKSRCYHIPPVWRAFSKSSVFVTDYWVWTEGLTVEIKLRFQIPRG